MSTTVTPTSSSSGTTPGAASSAAPPAVDKNMFLELLVAQLKNQDPLNPTDSMQFVQQLAQFQQLEQSVNMGQDIAAIRADMDQLAGTGDSTGSKS